MRHKFHRPDHKCGPAVRCASALLSPVLQRVAPASAPPSFNCFLFSCTLYRYTTSGTSLTRTPASHPRVCVCVCIFVIWALSNTPSRRSHHGKSFLSFLFHPWPADCMGYIIQAPLALFLLLPPTHLGSCSPVIFLTLSVASTVPSTPSYIPPFHRSFTLCYVPHLVRRHPAEYLIAAGFPSEH